MIVFRSEYEYEYDRTIYHQCSLRKKISNGYKTTTAFIPKEFSVKGKTIKLQGENNEWVDGWVVESISKEEFNSIAIDVLSKQYKHHRRISNV